MKNPVVALYSLGCVKNLIDSEQAMGELGLGGCAFTSEIGEADCIIVNTCTFVGEAEKESREAVAEALRGKAHRGKAHRGKAHRGKRGGRARWVFVVGCMGERYHRKLKRDFPKVDGVFGILTREVASEILHRINADAPEHVEERIRPRLRLTPRHYAYLRISDGCDNRCAYCIIPEVRGPLASRPMDMVVEEARHLVGDGAKELMIVAQDTTNYGVDLEGRRMLPELLDALDGLEGLSWLRLLYMHPAHVGDAVIERLAADNRVLRYVDLPLQHIADGVLERMGRGIDGEGSRRLLGGIRERVEDVVIRTTFIVGFPGETERDVEELIAFVGKERFHHVGVFAYSREEGTRAARMAGQIERAVSEERRGRVLEAQQKIVLERNRARVGKGARVLIDETDPGGAIGRSYGEAPDVDSVVVVEECTARVGEFVEVEIMGVRDYDVVARMKRGGGGEDVSDA